MSLALSNSGATCQAVDRERTRHGLEFGKAMYEYREQCSAHGNHQGKGFLQLCKKLEPPQSTAYYWINAYEESAGIRQVVAPAVATTPLAEPLLSRYESRLSSRRTTSRRTKPMTSPPLL